MRVSELSEGGEVFVDANIYLFNALDDPRYGLLPSDSFHLATMKELEMKFIVTDDADFKRVDWAAVVELEEGKTFFLKKLMM